MNESVIIIGASGHGKVVADIVLKSGDKLLGFLDDNKDLSDTFLDYPVLGTVDSFKEYLNAQFVIAIGNARIRQRLSEKLEGVSWYTAIHPSAIIATLDLKIGAGTVVMANAVINPGSRIGNHCIINTEAVIEHDNVIDDFAHISVGAKIAGTVNIGKRTWIGIGTIVSNNLKICSDCMIGAGTVVVKDIEEAGTYIGVPARRINKT